MKNKLVIIGIILVFLLVGLCGCVEETKKKDTLTDEDWNYMVWYQEITDKLININNEFSSLFNITNDSVGLLSTINKTKIKELYYQMFNLSKLSLENNSDYVLSKRIDNIRDNFSLILLTYINISDYYFSILSILENEAVYTEVNGSITINYGVINETSSLFGIIANELESIGFIYYSIGTFINEKISDDEYDEWSSGRDLSFLDD
jgi:hypothetical protein